MPLVDWQPREALQAKAPGAALVVASPNYFGMIEDAAGLSELAHSKGALLVALVDPVSLALLSPPGEYGADIAVGEGQSLGIPQNFGGPLLGFMATRSELIRDSLRDYLFLRRVRNVRRRLLPKARKQGIYTDKDVFERLA